MQGIPQGSQARPQNRRPKLRAPGKVGPDFGARFWDPIRARIRVPDFGAKVDSKFGPSLGSIFWVPNVGPNKMGPKLGPTLGPKFGPTSGTQIWAHIWSPNWDPHFGPTFPGAQQMGPLFWDPVWDQSRCCGGSGSFGDNLGHHLGLPGPPWSKKERTSDPTPPGPSWVSNCLLSVTF